MSKTTKGCRCAVYTVAEAAEILGIGRNLAYTGVREGWLPAIRLGHRLVVPRQVIDAMLAGPLPTTDARMDQGLPRNHSRDDESQTDEGGQ
jgi:excisionase family DNA binding protein